MKRTPICNLNQLTDPGSREFVVRHEATEVEGFVVYKDGLLSAFVNRCPHTGVPLNWSPHQFMDIDGEFIQCSMHGAIFRTQDGFCVRGPCVGESLESLPVSLQEGTVWLELD